MNPDFKERCDEIGRFNGLLATPSSTREILKRGGPGYTMCAIVEPWDAIHLTPIISLSRPNTLQRLQSELPGRFPSRSNGFVVIGLNREKYVSDQGLFVKATAVAELEKLGPTL